MRRPVLLGAMGLLAAACTRGSGPGATASPTPASGAPPVVDETTPLPSPLPDVVARVNGRPIYLRQIVGLAREALENSQDREKDKPGALRHAANQYVVRELLLQEAVSSKVTADPRRLEQLYDDIRVKYRDEKDWANYLVRAGQTPQSFKEELRIQQTVQALINEESGKVELGEEEARAYLATNPNPFGLGNRVTVARILCRVSPQAAPAIRAHAKLKAENALARIRKGEDFAKLAKEVSEDEASKKLGGRLPELKPGEADPAFESTAFALKPGEVSSVVQTAAGFEIVKLLEKRAEGVSFEQVRERLEPQLLRQKRQAALQGLVNRLRAQARIEMFL